MTENTNLKNIVILIIRKIDKTKIMTMVTYGNNNDEHHHPPRKVIPFPSYGFSIASPIFSGSSPLQLETEKPSQSMTRAISP